MKFLSLGAIFSFFWVLTVFGQQVLVLDQKSKVPIEGVMIFSQSGEKIILTDHYGKANLQEISDKNKLIFQIQGYQTKSLTWESLRYGQFTVFLQSSEIKLESAVISATRWRQNQSDVAERVRRLDQKQLLIQSPLTNADWLGSSGEVFIQKSQLGGGSPMIRGFSANRLLYAVDGVRMNTAIFRSGNLQNVISLDPFTLQTTEVQFGPGSVMYGSDAIGGVMVFETLAPSLERSSGNLLTRFSSAMKEKTVHANLSYGGKAWRFLSSISHFNFGDLKMGKIGGQDSYLRPDFVKVENGQDQITINTNPLRQVQTGYSQLNLMQKIQWNPNKFSTFDYGFHYSTTSEVPRYDRLIEKRNGKLRFAKWEYGPQKWLMNSLKWTYRGNSGWFDQLKLIFAQQYFGESRIDRRFGNTGEFERKEVVHAFSVNGDFLKNFSESNYLSYGMEWVHNQVKSTGQETNILSGQTSPASARYPNANWNSWAMYGSFHQRFFESLRFQAALRYNFTEIKADFSNNAYFFPLPFTTAENKHHSLTGNLGLIYTPKNSLTISPVLSTGFRAPNVDDIGKIFDSEPGTVLVPNPNLKPEYAYNAEININKFFGSKLKTDFTAFYTLLDQAMVRRPFLFNGQLEIEYSGEMSSVMAIQNAAFAKIHGIQAAIEYHFNKSWTLTSRYNLQKGIEELDDETQSPSRHAAPAFGLTQLTFQKNKLLANLSSIYSAKRSAADMPEDEKGKPIIYAQDENGNLYSPAWIIINLNIQYSICDYLTFSGGIENILDRQYRPYSSGIVAPGRNFKFTLKASF